jgi:hypothetical protein
MSLRKGIMLLLIFMLCIWTVIIFSVIDSYRNLRPAFEVGKTGLVQNLFLNTLLLNTLETRRYSQIKGHLTPKFQKEIGIFVEEWERTIQEFGQVRSFEAMVGSLERRSEDDVSVIASEWQCRVHLKDGTVAVRWIQVYHQGTWQIDSVVLQRE